MSSGKAIWSKNCNKVRYGRTLGLLLKKWIKVKERKWSPFLGKKIAVKWLCIALSYPVSLIFFEVTVQSRKLYFKKPWTISGANQRISWLFNETSEASNIKRVLTKRSSVGGLASFSQNFCFLQRRATLLLCNSFISTMFCKCADVTSDISKCC